MTIDFNYNQFMTQWLLLGPGLIDWVTGATHLGLYRNYSTIHVDDMFTPDDAWSTTTHANDYNPADALRMQTGRRRHRGDVVEDQQLPARLALQRRQLDRQTRPPRWPTRSWPSSRQNDPRDRQAVHAGLRLAQPHLGPRLPRRRLRHAPTTSKPKSSRTRSGPPPAPGTSGLGGLGLTSSTIRQLRALGAAEPHDARARRPLRLRQPRAGQRRRSRPAEHRRRPWLAAGGSLCGGQLPVRVDRSVQRRRPAHHRPVVGVGDHTDHRHGRSEGQRSHGTAVCHAANYLVYREVGDSNNWFLVGNVPTPATATPPATLTADPTGGSTTNTTGGGMQVQTFVDNTGPTAGTDRRHELGCRRRRRTRTRPPWEQNPNFLTAMNALDMTSVGTDASKPYPNPANNQFGIGVARTPARRTRPASTFPDGTLRGRAPAPDQHLLQQLDRDPGGRRVQHALRRAAGGQLREHHRSRRA